MSDHRQFILGTAGHIDHGKTALVRALTGIDTDRLEQEKQRGISIDIGFAHLDLDSYRIGIVDVPGHERFIKNMLAGASGIDIAMLIVAADDSVMPQTREHLAILELLEIERGLIIITKTDLAEPDWVDLVEQDVRELVAGTFLQDASIVRASAITEEGLDDVRAALRTLCDEVEPTERDEPFRLAVDRSFVMQGLGTVVTGTVASGAVAVGEELDWLPSGASVRVRGIQSHGSEHETAQRAQRAALQLTGAHHSEIVRGHVLAAPGYLKPARLLTGHLHVLADSPWPVKHRSRVRLYLGTQEIIAQVRLLEGTSLAQGERGYVQFACAEPAAALGHQPFVVRSESPLRTIGGGRILLPVSMRIARRDTQAKEKLDALNSNDPQVRSAAAIYFNAARPLDVLTMCRLTGLDRTAAQSAIDALIADGVITRVPMSAGRETLLHRDYSAQLEQLVVDSIRRLHEASPLELSFPRQTILQRLHYIETAIMQSVIDRLIERKALTGDGGDRGDRGDQHKIALPGAIPTLTEAQRQLSEQVLSALKSASFKPPTLSDLANSLGAPLNKLRSVVDLCVAQRQLVHIDGEMFLHADWESELRQRLRKRLGGGRSMTVSEIKDLLGATRKYAVPLCEYLDRVGFTRREGDRRVLAAAPAPS